MKTKFILSSVLLAVGLALTAPAHEKGVTLKAGPNGGRVLTAANPPAEFWVMPDKKIQITFLDAKDKPIAPSGQVVTVTTGQRTAPVTLTFEQKGDALVSTKPLTADKQPAIVQIKSTPDGRPSVDRFTIDLSICGECNHPEYACTCRH
jgi:hypothetical protein